MFLSKRFRLARGINQHGRPEYTLHVTD
jgi:hypothetical protein